MKTIEDINEARSTLDQLDQKSKIRKQKTENIYGVSWSNTSQVPPKSSESIHRDPISNSNEGLLEKFLTSLEWVPGFIKELTPRERGEVVCFVLLFDVLDKASVKFIEYVSLKSFMYRSVLGLLIVSAFDFLYKCVYKFFPENSDDKDRMLKLLHLTHLFYALVNIIYAYSVQDYTTLNLGVIIIIILQNRF